MSADQSTPKPEPRLCKMGCGFFGSGATEDCCSKCFLDMQKKRGCVPVQKKVEQPAAEHLPVEESMTEPMDVEEEVKPAPTPDKKKKKKKTSYKAMMAAMTQSSGKRDIEQEKESIRKATGGGAFSKIDKI